MRAGPYRPSTFLLPPLAFLLRSHNDFSTLAHPVSVTLDATHQRGEAYPMIVQTAINVHASAGPAAAALGGAETRV